MVDVLRAAASRVLAPPRPFEALSSARAWHAYAEGLRPCKYLHYTVPYFPGEMPRSGPTRTTPPRVIRLADCPDAAEVEAVLATPDPWAYPFDATMLADYWRLSRAGDSTAVQERMLRSAVWQAGFEDHWPISPTSPDPTARDAPWPHQ